MSGSDDDRMPSDTEPTVSSGKTTKKVSGKQSLAVITKKPAAKKAPVVELVDSDAEDDSSDVSLLPARLLPVKKAATKAAAEDDDEEEDDDEDDEEDDVVDSDDDSMDEDKKLAVVVKKPAVAAKPKQSKDSGIDDKKPAKKRSGAGAGGQRCPFRYPKYEGWTLICRPDVDAEDAVKSASKGGGPKKLFASTKHSPETYVSVWAAKSGSITWTTRAVGQPSKNSKPPSNERGELLILDSMVWIMPKVQNRFADCKGAVEKFLKAGLTSGDVKMPYPTTFCNWIRDGKHNNISGGGEDAAEPRGRSSSPAAAAASSKKSKSPKAAAAAADSDPKSVAAKQAKDLNGVDAASQPDTVVERLFPKADSQATMTLDNFFIACASHYAQDQAGFEARTKNLTAYVEKFHIETASTLFVDDKENAIERLFPAWFKMDDFDSIIQASMPLCILSILSYKEQYADPLLVELTKLAQAKQAKAHDYDLLLAKLDTANRDLNAMQQQKVTLEQQLLESKDRLSRAQHANALHQKHAAVAASLDIPKSPATGKPKAAAALVDEESAAPSGVKGKRRVDAEVPDNKKQRATPETTTKAAASTPLLTPIASPAPGAAAAPARPWLAIGLDDSME